MNFRKLYARMSGKFWDKCPRCNEPFGGHEKHSRDVVIEGENYRIVCGRCTGQIKPKGRKKMVIQVGSKSIGEGCPPFIIAEVGSNWKTKEDCLNSIHLAKACGADAVKFQLFDEKALYGFDVDAVRLKEYQQTVGGYQFNTVDSHDLKPMREASMPVEWLPALKSKADAVGIEFMCTAFSPELYDVVDPFVNIHKVASAELSHIRILEKLRALGKPVILSTGASGQADITMALAALGKETPTVLMYCVAAYPAREVNLDNINLLKSTFNTLTGYSDHTTDVFEIPQRAIKSGACVIEKHVNFVEADGPDAPHSLSTDEFRRMVSVVRGGIQASIGSIREEKGMVLRHNRRIIATRDLSVGDTLTEGTNFGIYRSLKDDTNAAHPFMINQMNGKAVKRAIKAGDGIAPGDV
jgi:N-acetylneuraminate synthase